MKKNKKIRRKVFGLLSILVGATSILTLRSPLFYSVEASGKLTSPDGYKMFDKFQLLYSRYLALNENFQPAFANMTSVLCIMCMSLVGLFLLFFLLQLTKQRVIPCRSILKAISIALVFVGLVSIACSLTFVIMNKITYNGKAILSFKYAYGTYILIGASLLSGIFGIISQLRYKKKFNKVWFDFKTYYIISK